MASDSTAGTAGQDGPLASLVVEVVTAGTLFVAFDSFALGVEWFRVAFPIGLGGVRSRSERFVRSFVIIFGMTSQSGRVGPRARTRYRPESSHSSPYHSGCWDSVPPCRKDASYTS